MGWGVQNSRTFFCEYTLRRRWVVFGNRLKGWRSWPVYRSALPPQSSASWAVASVPRFKAWSRAACLASGSSQDKTRLGPRYDNHSFEEEKNEGAIKNIYMPTNKIHKCPPMSCDSETELSLSSGGSLPRNLQPSSANRPKFGFQ